MVMALTPPAPPAGDSAFQARPDCAARGGSSGRIPKYPPQIGVCPIPLAPARCTVRVYAMVLSSRQRLITVNGFIWEQTVSCNLDLTHDVHVVRHRFLNHKLRGKPASLSLRPIREGAFVLSGPKPPSSAGPLALNTSVSYPQGKESPSPLSAGSV